MRWRTVFFRLFHEARLLQFALIMAGAAVFGTVYVAATGENFAVGAERATATVVSMQFKSGRGADSYLLDVRYVTEAGESVTTSGKIVASKLPAGAGPGSHLPILYLPRRPDAVDLLPGSREAEQMFVFYLALLALVPAFVLFHGLLRKTASYFRARQGGSVRRGSVIAVKTWEHWRGLDSRDGFYNSRPRRKGVEFARMHWIDETGRKGSSLRRVRGAMPALAAGQEIYLLQDPASRRVWWVRDLGLKAETA